VVVSALRDTGSSGEQPAPEEVKQVGIGVSVFLIAVGAILAWAVEVDAEGINLDAVGVILMVVGGLGLLLSMLFWSSFAPFGSREERTIVRDRERVV
jgi:hypothetical protein